MDLLILGAGTAITQKNRTCPSYLLNIENKFVLLDVGPTAVYRLLEINFDLIQLSSILISHNHIDHILGLFHLLFIYKHPEFLEKKPKVNILGSENTIELIRNVILNFEGMIEPTTYSLASLARNEEFSLEGKYKVKAYSISHHISSLAYAFFSGNKKIFVYAGDTDFDEEIIEVASDADYLLIECSFPNDIRVKGHLIPSECAEIANRAGVKNTIITHFYPQATKELIQKECEKFFKSNFIIAEDNKLIKLEI